MSPSMIDYPHAAWTKPQLIEQLETIAHLFVSKVFKPSAPFSRQSQLHWFRLIRSVSDLLRQSAQAGLRINFTQEVSASGEDISALLDRMRQESFLITTTSPFQQRDLLILAPHLNYVSGQCSGRFTNGLWYCCPHPHELAFFIGQDRIYFFRHLMRAYLEAGCYLISLPDSTLTD
ncbi:hypothetical protein [Spirosoma koreense]